MLEKINRQTLVCLSYCLSGFSISCNQMSSFSKKTVKQKADPLRAEDGEITTAKLSWVRVPRSRSRAENGGFLSMCFIGGAQRTSL